MSSASAVGVRRFIERAARHYVGHGPFEISRLMAKAYQDLFAARGNCSNPRFGALVLAGLDMALWDLAGKVCGLAVHQLLGGAVRDRIQYFGFPQGETAEELAQDAARWVKEGCDVIYVKVGRGEQVDLEIVRQVREAIGDRRLRVDANEAWDLLTAQRMIRALAPYGLEFVEQPTRSESLAALEHIRMSVPTAIAADQIVFTPEDAYELCRKGAADLLVLGLHECGGIDRLRRASAIAAAAGINICLHGLYETGITTCASLQVGATLANLDDGNQYMNHLLTDDIIDSPDLRLVRGQLPVIEAPGLGFELDWDAVARAEEAYRNAETEHRYDS